MAENKTQATSVDHETFIAGVENEQKRSDCRVLVDLMRKITGAEPVMWGPSIIGFGDYHYKYESGREGDFFLTGFSPRKNALALYGIEHKPELMSKLGKHTTGKSCVYVKKLDDINLDVLEELIRVSVAHLSTYYSES